MCLQLVLVVVTILMPIGIPAPRAIVFIAVPCSRLLLLLLLVSWTSPPAAVQATQSPACPKAACYNITAWSESADQPSNLLVIFKVCPNSCSPFERMLAFNLNEVQIFACAKHNAVMLHDYGFLFVRQHVVW